jgi:hypothetical protein
MPQSGTAAKCHTQALVDSLPPAAQVSLNRGLATPQVKTSDLLNVLAEHGLEARAENMNRHRRRLLGGTYACKCPLPDGVTA